MALYVHHMAVMDIIEAAFTATRRIGRIDGKTPKPKRQAIIDGLRDPNGPYDLGILSESACGTAITLCPGVHIIVIVEVPMTPALAMQIEDRSHRIGAIRDVECIYPIAARSFDAEVMAMLGRKDETNAFIMDGAASTFTFEPLPESWDRVA